jgi:hypothetical protein
VTRCVTERNEVPASFRELYFSNIAIYFVRFKVPICKYWQFLSNLSWKNEFKHALYGNVCSSNIVSYSDYALLRLPADIFVAIKEIGQSQMLDFEQEDSNFKIWFTSKKNVSEVRPGPIQHLPVTIGVVIEEQLQDALLHPSPNPMVARKIRRSLQKCMCIQKTNVWIKTLHVLVKLLLSGYLLHTFATLHWWFSYFCQAHFSIIQLEFTHEQKTGPC